MLDAASPTAVAVGHKMSRVPQADFINELKAPSKVTFRHSRESGNPARSGVTRTPACPGGDDDYDFHSIGWAAGP